MKPWPIDRRPGRPFARRSRGQNLSSHRLRRRGHLGLLVVVQLWMVISTPLKGQPDDPPIEHPLLLVDRPAVVEMRIAALIMSGQQGGALPIAVAAIPDGQGCGDGDESSLTPSCRLTALVEVDGAALLEGSPEGPIPIEVYAYVLGTELDVLAQHSLTFDAGQPEHRQALVNTGVKIFLPLEVPPGEHLLRILVQAGDDFGLRSRSLRTASSGPSLAISTPIFHEVIGPWLLAAPAGEEIRLPSVFDLQRASPLPAARPLIPTGGEILGQVFLTGLDSPNAIDSIEFSAIVRQPEGTALDAPLTVMPREEALPRDGKGGVESITIAFSPPPEIAPGLWELAVAETQSETGARSDFVSIFVEPPTLPPSLSAIETETLAEARPTHRGTRQQVRAVQSAYVQALRQLANGDPQAARSILMANEGQTIEALDAEGVELLSQTQVQVLAALPDSDWQCLLPAILLHSDLSQIYRQNSQHILAHHATQMTAHLAQAYAHKLDTPDAFQEAAKALASLAGHIQQAGALSRSERLYTQSLELAANDAALLGLATLHEKRGQFELAVPVLERLLKERPKHAEGALRLALNRARTGRPAAAIKALPTVAAQHDDDWAALLAHQELARLLMEDGRQSRAENVLRRGLKRWPSQPTLRLQLAWVLDARKQQEPSLELLEQLAESPGQPSGERSRYNRWSTALLVATRQVLSETANARWDQLEGCLSKLAPEDLN